MQHHYLIKNEAGEYFAGFKRRIEHPDFEFRPYFAMLVEHGFSLAVVIEGSRLQEVEESLRLEGIKYTIIEV